tara:strand:+ start:50 stop:679 length:630 start_codon:yes stop_codon:yes gene_type:complete
MPKLLHIEASPHERSSHSIEMAHVFLESYREAHPTDDVETLNVWSADLPELNASALGAKYAVLKNHKKTPEQIEAWNGISKTVEHFKSASKYLLSLPMWNYSIPYQLKRYIDVITQPGLTYSFDSENGYNGLVRGCSIAVIYARGDEYGKESKVEDMDFQKPYIETWLRFIGFADIRPIVIEPTMKGQEKIQLVKAFAKDHIQKIAKEI